MHQILRQVVEVDVHGDEQVGLEVQRQVSHLCRHAVSAHLEAAFAPFDVDGRYYVIDRMEVDLGAVSLEGLEAALTRSLSAAVATKMRERGLTPRTSETTGSRDDPCLSRDEALLESVLHFLRHGRLPWWYAGANAQPLDEQLMSLLSSIAGDAWQPGGGNSLLRSPQATFVEALIRNLRSDGRARERLLHQFSTPCVLTLLERMDAGQHARVLQALRTVRLSSLSGPLRDRFETGLVEAAIDAVVSAARDAAPVTTEDLLRVSAARLAPRLSADDRKSLARTLGVEVRADLDARSPPPAQHHGEDTVASDGLHVENAGVVLLHSFLPQFFGGLGIARDDALVHPARAALLLHHLATGALTAEEHELVLAKVLCGLPIESPVPREAPVTVEEQAEATALLDSVVRHWDVLRHTTADGLRGNFLARRGRIELREGDWVLRVETRSYDMLLDSLPWGVAHVKLPWMPRLMHVEWTA